MDRRFHPHCSLLLEVAPARRFQCLSNTVAYSRTLDTLSCTLFWRQAWIGHRKFEVKEAKKKKLQQSLCFSSSRLKGVYFALCHFLLQQSQSLELVALQQRGNNLSYAVNDCDLRTTSLARCNCLHAFFYASNSFRTTVNYNKLVYQSYGVPHKSPTLLVSMCVGARGEGADVAPLVRATGSWQLLDFHSLQR